MELPVFGDWHEQPASSLRLDPNHEASAHWAQEGQATSFIPTHCSMLSDKASNSSDASWSTSCENHPEEEINYKIFVGGVPRSMDRAALIGVFTGLGVKVKQAWLHKRRKLSEGPAPAGTRAIHRGFGFVILHDGHSMQKVLGTEHPRFLDLPGGNRLEFKRAMPHRALPQSGPEPGCVETGEADDAPDPEVWKASVALGLCRGLSMPAAVAAATRALLPCRGGSGEGSCTPQSASEHETPSMPWREPSPPRLAGHSDEGAAARAIAGAQLLDRSITWL